MTTVVIDIKHKRVVTDGRLTDDKAMRLKPTFLLGAFIPAYDPWIRERVVYDEYYNKFYRIKSDDGQTIFCCAAGKVHEIMKFLDCLKKRKFPKKFLRGSTVTMMKFKGDELMVYSAKDSKISKVTSESWMTMGSGCNYACGALENLCEDDKNRAYKAVQTAIQYDEGSGGIPRIYELKEFDDIY